MSLFFLLFFFSEESVILSWLPAFGIGRPGTIPSHSITARTRGNQVVIHSYHTVSGKLLVNIQTLWEIMFATKKNPLEYSKNSSLLQKYKKQTANRYIFLTSTSFLQLKHCHITFCGNGHSQAYY